MIKKIMEIGKYVVITLIGAFMYLEINNQSLILGFMFGGGVLIGLTSLIIQDKKKWSGKKSNDKHFWDNKYDAKWDDV